jgi:hypothetical protein
MVNRDHWIVVLQKLEVKGSWQLEVLINTQIKVLINAHMPFSVAVLKLWQSDFQRLEIIYDHEVFLLCHLWHEALGFKVQGVDVCHETSLYVMEERIYKWIYFLIWCLNVLAAGVTGTDWKLCKIGVNSCIGHGRFLLSSSEKKLAAHLNLVSSP